MVGNLNIMNSKHLYMSIKYYLYNSYKKYFLKKKNKYQGEIKLNLGCGFDYKSGWVNVDTNTSCVVDLRCDFLNLDEYFEHNSISHVVLNHSISYLNLWQARVFFSKVLRLLKSGGKLEMEFPDILKCSKVISSTNSEEEYLEAIRGIYAFDLDQIKNSEVYFPYSFGWSGIHISTELQKIGFSKVEILDPTTHGPRIWRDTRIIGYKD